jgi:hypothetical protein
MRLRKILLASILAVISALNAIGMGIAFATEGSETAVPYIIITAFSLYTLTLSARSVAYNTTRTHTEHLLHLTILTTIVTALFVASAIIPAGHISDASHGSPLLEKLWIVVAVLDIVSATMSFTIPSGPPLYFPPEQIFGDKAVKTDVHVENVTGVVGMYRTLVGWHSLKLIALSR